MPQAGETRTGKTETVQWDGSRWQPVTDEPSVSSPHGLSPSGLSMLGSLLGIPLGRVGTALGSAIGSEVNDLKDSVPKLIEMARHGGGLTGPVDSRGVGTAMLDPLEHVATDVAENTGLNELPGVVGSALSKGGRALARAGEAASETTPIKSAVRFGSGVLAHLMGIGPGGTLATEAATVAAPPIARVVGPVIAKAGDALPATTMEGLRAAIGAMTPGIEESAEETPTVLSNLPLSKEALARNIEATNLRDVEGFSHTQAGRLAGIPGAGEHVVTNVPMGEHAITDEMITNGGSAPHADITTDGNSDEEIGSPSLRGLLDALADPLAESRDDAVRRYLASWPDSELNRVRTP